MTSSPARTRVVLLHATPRPGASSSAGPQAARIRRFRLARAHLQAQRAQDPPSPAG